MELKGSKTEENLKAAFAGESQANRRYLYFASKAAVEGQDDDFVPHSLPLAGTEHRAENQGNAADGTRYESERRGAMLRP